MYQLQQLYWMTKFFLITWLAPGKLEKDHSGYREGWSLVWEDEFRGDTLDNKKWPLVNWDLHWATHQPQQTHTFTNNNIEVKDGKCYIHIKREDTPGHTQIDGERVETVQQYSSGQIRTHKTFQYGYFEARVKLPKAHGSWPAFWLYRETELDIFEIHPTRPKVSTFNHHIWRYANGKAGTKGGKIRSAKNLSDEFHVWGMDWDALYVKFYLDGIMINKWKHEGRFTHWMHIIFSLAQGGWGGTPVEEHYPDAMIIDWIRVYQKK